MFNKNFLLTNTINLNYSNFEYHKNYKLSATSNYILSNYISKKLLYNLTKKQQHFFFYGEKDLLLPFYLYNFEIYKQLFLFGDWYAGYITNYVNIRQNLLKTRTFSNFLFVNFFKQKLSLFIPQGYVFLNPPKDLAAFSEFNKLKSVYFEDPSQIQYKNSYLFGTATIFNFFFNLYLILFQFNKHKINKQLRLHKKFNTYSIQKSKKYLKIKFFRCRLFLYTL